MFFTVQRWLYCKQMKRCKLFWKWIFCFKSSTKESLYFFLRLSTDSSFEGNPRKDFCFKWVWLWTEKAGDFSSGFQTYALRVQQRLYHGFPLYQSIYTYFPLWLFMINISHLRRRGDIILSIERRTDDAKSFTPMGEVGC